MAIRIPELEEHVVKVSIVAMVIAAGMMLPASARGQVNVNVSIGHPPPVVAQPVLVPVLASPVYYAMSGPDLFFYDGRYYTVRDDRWFHAARINTRWVAISIDRVPPQILAVPATYYRVPPGHLKHKGGHCPPGQAKKGRC